MWPDIVLTCVETLFINDVNNYVAKRYRKSKMFPEKRKIRKKISFSSFVNDSQLELKMHNGILEAKKSTLFYLILTFSDFMFC